MTDVVTALTTGITPAALFSSLAAVAGLVTTAVLVSFGIGVLRRTVSGIGKGKARI